MQKLKYAAVAVLCSMVSQVAYADWHQGKVTQIAFGYDGSTITFLIDGWNRSNCTCYPTWPNLMCLDRSRLSFKEEFAWLLKARSLDQSINVHIDEQTCRVVALYEFGNQ